MVWIVGGMVWAVSLLDLAVCWLVMAVGMLFWAVMLGAMAVGWLVAMARGWLVAMAVGWRACGFGRMAWSVGLGVWAVWNSFGEL